MIFIIIHNLPSNQLSTTIIPFNKIIVLFLMSALPSNVTHIEQHQVVPLYVPVISISYCQSLPQNAGRSSWVVLMLYSNNHFYKNITHQFCSIGGKHSTYFAQTGHGADSTVTDHCWEELTSPDVDAVIKSRHTEPPELDKNGNTNPHGLN